MAILLVPSGKRLRNYGKSPFFMGKLTISMAIFNSYVKLPEGILHFWRNPQGRGQDILLPLNLASDQLGLTSTTFSMRAKWREVLSHLSGAQRTMDCLDESQRERERMKTSINPNKHCFSPLFSQFSTTQPRNVGVSENGVYPKKLSFEEDNDH